MDQFLYSTQNALLNVQDSIVLLFRNHLTWAFILGFGASTAIHLVILLDNPKELKQVLSKDPAASYLEIANQKDDGTYDMSYADFKNKYDRLKNAFAMTVFVAVVVGLFAVIRYSS
jgi:energy-converting hydrogenase Eha subunit F